MQLKVHVSHDFSQMETNDQVLFGTNVIAILTLNAAANFPDLPYTIAQLTSSNDTLDEKYDAYRLQGASAKGAFENAEDVWNEMFSRTADYIDLVANGSLELINLSGYNPTKAETVPASLPVSPVADLSIDNNARGCVAVKVKGVKNAKGYLFAMATEGIGFEIVGNQITVRSGNEFATFIIATQREVTFTGLPQTEVKAATAAFNSAGIGALSSLTPVVIP